MLRLFAVCSFALVLAFSAASQTVSTEILGLVTDPTGAVIPGVSITVKRVATGDVRTTLTNETGNYVFPLLDIGEYDITCSARGFKTEVMRGVILQLQQKARINFQMHVGEQVEMVEVRGAASLLRTEDATLGSVIESKRVVDLPLNGRNFGQLATLMPGVVIGTRMGEDGQGGIPIPGQMVGISANGQRDINQNATVDGVVSTETRTSMMPFTPSIEAIEEFKVQSAVYSAEYGMNSGAQINVAIKSGTNQLHATIFEFVRNNQFDARGFFLPPEQPKNKLRRNQYGTVVSGPIIKDKTFWLFNWEARRERRATPQATAVPTLEMRAGDFSEILQPRNRWYRNDPNPAASRAIRAPGSSAPFPNNIIPPSLINPVSKNILTWKKTSPFPDGGFIAYPNIDGQARANGSPINLAGTNADSINSDQFLGRVDHRFGQNDRIFARYVFVEANWQTVPLDKITQSNTTSRPQNLAVGYSKIISANIFNDFRYGYSREVDDTLGLHTNTDFTHRDLGLDIRVVTDNNRTLTPREEGLPNIGITGFTGISLGNTIGRFNVCQIHEVSDGLSVNHGKHNFKFGGLYRYNFLNTVSGNVPRGTLSFSADIVGIPDGMAAFMLGYPTSAATGEGKSPVFARQNKFGFYWLDDFKATSKLTINFGVRWDIFGSVQDAQGKLRNLSFADGEARTINGMFVPMLVPDPGMKKKLNEINLTQIMPRLGIAYRLNNTLVLRTGAGQFYNAQQMNNHSILALAPPFSGSSVFNNDRNNPQATIQNPFAGTGTVAAQALVMLGNIDSSRGNRSFYLNNDLWQWTMEIEKSLGQSLVFGVAYVGSKGSNIDINIANFNNPNPGLGNIQARRPIQFYVDSRTPDRLLPLSTIRLLDTSQNSFYHALQLRAEKRYARGLTFVASYNLQKALAVGYEANQAAGFGSNTPQNPRNTQLDRGRALIDQRHRFVFSHIWELPWMRTRSGLTGTILGGWAINGIVQLTSGLPVTVSQSGDSHNNGGGAPRPNVVAGKSVPRVSSDRNLDHWFDTTAFVRSKCDGCPGDGLFLPGTLGYGNAGVSLLDAPGQKTWDFALFKDFRIKEGHRLQFRWEAFNFLNTPQFSAPSRSLGNATFGRITSTGISNREMQLALKYVF